jgi:hypothetical protein
VCATGWVMYYLPAGGSGIKFYYANCDTYNSSNSVFKTGMDVRITQVYLN